MMPPLRPDAAIVDGMLTIYIGGHYMQLSPEISGPYVRKLQGLDAQLQREVKREERARRKARAA